MDGSEVFQKGNIGLKLANEAFTIFDAITRGTDIEFDPVLHYSINASLCEFMGATNRMAVSLALVHNERKRREKRAEEEAHATESKQTEMPLDEPAPELKPDKSL